MTYEEAIRIAEQALANNLTWLHDKLDLEIRQHDADTLKRLTELTTAWETLAKIAQSQRGSIVDLEV